MKTEKKKIERVIIKDGKEVPKTIHDYSGEELDQLAEEDPEYEEKLWEEAELEALNNPENHDKSI